MPSTTSPSDFIYQRPFCSDSARAEPSTTIYHGEEGAPTNYGAGSEDPITAIDHENKTSGVPEDPYHGPTASSRAHPVPYQDGSQTAIPHISSSLLKNISNICNMLWAGSQRDRLTVLNVERLAVDNMAKLLLWGETVVLDDSEGKALNDRETFHRVLDAGKHLCVWLGAQESLRDMEELGRAWPYASDQI